MLWRASGLEARRTDGKSRKAALKRRVAADVPIGILGYFGDEPVAWCSIAPRESYRTLGGKDDGADAPQSVWLLVRRQQKLASERCRSSPRCRSSTTT